MLAQILRRKRQDLSDLKARVPLADLERRAQSAPPPRSLATALRRGRRLAADGALNPALIAELKRASPSRGLIRPDFEAGPLARQYRDAGASALSVLTDVPFFQGNPAYVAEARQASGLPVLRKDFLLEPYQVLESRALGADAVLLIVAALGRDRVRLSEMLQVTGFLGMDALVEVHDEAELIVALGAGARIIGINNRDLRTFRTDLGVTEALARQVPADHLVVSESGIAGRQDLLRVGRKGAAAALVGEALMRRQDLVGATREMLAPAPPATAPWVKVCGHTRREPLAAALESGASAVGFVFAPSRRRVSPLQAQVLARDLPAWFERIGVFVAPEAGPTDPWLREVTDTCRFVGLTGVQLHGCESPAAVALAKAALTPEVRLIVAIRVRDSASLAILPSLARAGADAILLDAFVPGQMGGTGRDFDWSLARLARERLGPGVPCYLAGGLRPENVAQARDQSGADGFDVSSGVETDGVKDPAKMRAFMRALGGM